MLAWFSAHRTEVLSCVFGLLLGISASTGSHDLQSLLINQVHRTAVPAVTETTAVTAPVSMRLQREKLRMQRALERIKRRKSTKRATSSVSPVAVRATAIVAAEKPVILHSSADFPSMGFSVFPVSVVPNWGAMRTPAEWNRSFAQLTQADFVDVPSYDLSRLLVPMKELVNPRNDTELTRKLFYSTKFFGAYDLDAGEFTAAHPGVDLKLAEGTPVGSVAGGRVHAVRSDDVLGIHVIVEHRAADGRAFYSIYGHLGSAIVTAGQDVAAGTMLGIIGMTGNTSGAHLHFQVDRGEPGEAVHRVYAPFSLPTRETAARYVVHPIDFIMGKLD